MPNKISDPGQSQVGKALTQAAYWIAEMRVQRRSGSDSAPSRNIQLSEELISDTSDVSDGDSSIASDRTVLIDDEDAAALNGHQIWGTHYDLEYVSRSVKAIPVAELRRVCRGFRIYSYYSRLSKKEVVDLLVSHLCELASECSREAFNTLARSLNDFLRTKSIGSGGYPIDLLPPIVNHSRLLSESNARAGRARRPRIPAAFCSANVGDVVPLVNPLYLEVIGVDRPFACGIDFADPLPRHSSHRILVAFYIDPSSEFLQAKGAKALPGFRGLTTTGLVLLLNEKPIRKYGPFRGTPLWDVTEAYQRGQQNRLLVMRPIDASRARPWTRAGLVVEVFAARPVGVPIILEPPASPVRIVYPTQTLLWEAIFTKEPTKIEAVDALARIKAKHVKTGNGTADDDDDVLGSTLIPLSLKCPLTLRRIERPVRLEACGHVQCFDYAQWAIFGRTTVVPSTQHSAAQKAVQAGCPVCGEALKAESVAFEDGWFASLLQEYADRPEVTRVLFDAATGTHDAALIEPEEPSDRDIENDAGSGGNVFNVDKSDEVLETTNGRVVDLLEAYELRLQQGIRPDRPIVID